MKKITFLLLSAFCFVGMYAQQPTSVSEADALGMNIFENSYPGTAVITGQRSGSAVTTYTDRATFQGDCTGTLTLEDVGGGPGGISACGEAISAAGGPCFAPGEIIADLVVTIGAIGSGQTTVYADQGSGFPNANPVIGSNTFTDFTVVNLTGKTSVGFDLIALVAGANVEVRVFGTGGMIDMFNLDATSGGDVFLGMIADEEIVSVELEDLSGASAELLGSIEIGDCVILGVNDNLVSQVSVFPNPANEVLNVFVPASLEITGAVLYDVLGKDTGLSLVNGQMNTANLARGVYLLNVQTTAGSITKKIVKE